VLSAGDDRAEAQDSLIRVLRAVDRMAGMIDTLLAYTTARDAPLRTRDLDLGELVAEVVQDRTGHVADEDRPDVYIGELPPVHADPDMLRHVLDNLVGNAIKYVKRGTVARIDVTATTGDGWVRVEIADRGIGIPDRDKPDVFQSFHRAHAAAGYAGTGLGLAICRRIVERHGGEIGITDNPGGGTRFHFSLPSPVREKEGSVVNSEPEQRAALERALAERAEVESLGAPARAPEPDRHKAPTSKD
jgi:signal transduction histidine kinase